MSGEKCELVDQPNADVLLEVVGYGSGPTGSTYLRKRLFFPFRPIEGDEVFFDGDAMKPATVAVVDWFVIGAKASLQVRLESQGLDDKDIEALIEDGWVEHSDAAAPASVKKAT